MEKQENSRKRTMASEVKPKIVYRNERSFRHDLFKADIRPFLKNVSFKPGIVDIHKVEHTHFFHSHNSQGKPQMYTNAVGAHFHKVTVSVDAEGNLIAKCGPPLRKVTKKRGGRYRSVIEAVTWSGSKPGEDGKTIIDDEDVGGDSFTDNHTHTFEYLGSENIDQNKIKSIQQNNANSIRVERSETVQENDIVEL